MARAELHTRHHYRHWHRLGTRWSDNDQYGHVNNVVHYHWFDTVVNAWLIERDLLHIGAESEADEVIGLVVETGCRYAQPLAYPQDVDVGLAVESIGTSSVRYLLGIFANAEPRAAAEGHFVHVYVNRRSRRPVPLPDRWREAIEEIKVLAAD